MKNNQLDGKRFQDMSKKYRRNYWARWKELYCTNQDGEKRAEISPRLNDRPLVNPSVVGSKLNCT